MSEIDRLLHQWRIIADAWELHLKGCDSARMFTDAHEPPAPGRGQIQNWINWLRACAADAERALKADGLR